jgi:REP element-mobilizing transposase RayT
MPSTYTKLLCHVVFSTKLRAPYLAQPIRDDVFRYIAGIINRKNSMAVEIGGVEDHIHILMQITPTVALADLVR